MKSVGLTLVALVFASGVAVADDSCCSEKGKGHPTLPNKVESSASKIEASAELKEVTFRITGMSCTTCYGKILGALSTLKGIAEAEPSIPNKNCRVKYDPSLVTPTQMVAAVNQHTPYEASLQ